MIVPKWRLKQAWMYPFMRMQAGADLYEWLTARVLGTQAGMSRKWCYWFREHVVLCRRFGGAVIPGGRIWLFQPGWSLAPVILSRLASGHGPLVTEDRRRLAGRYLPIALDEVGMVEGKIRASAKADLAGSGQLDLLGRLRQARCPDEALGICEAHYRVGDLPSLEDIPDRSIDLCMSMGRLEHFSESELRWLFGQMRRILVSGGLGSHIVDHRDHYWHYDKSIHCFHHLEFSDARWKAICRGRKSYRNRLLEPDYLRLFEQAGFEVMVAKHDLHRQDAEGVDPNRLWGHYAELTGKDLEAAVSHIVVRNP